MDSNVRQERRRRIMERGSDRLALITGQVRALSPSPSLPSPSNQRQRRHAHTESSPSLMFSPNDNAQINAGPEETDDVSGSKFMKTRTINEYPGARNFHRGNQAETRLVKSATSPDTLSKLQQPSEITPSVQKAPSQPKLFSSKRINYCIIASERTRAICSLIVAFLVIVNSDSFIASRPFCIILLTDVTIVLARLFRESGNDSEEIEEEQNSGKEDEDNWAGAVKLLERGLFLYQAICGIFTDCSVYLVAVICGLSLV
ncbi:hypothetical protein P3X46_010971 [Hevea brasiliensis]|uniref:Reticulon domain-containing protein n=1 Tax=Hevea brasiliensis TaxID=3981 RepID=A0ABQ9MG31_HEVBR|nr:uncharacterized protein LOC131169253 [Hevea brasiliensis]KAJ9179152.1 hypothetical protein P3X46_010971 [Hevea brasiliensis]